MLNKSLKEKLGKRKYKAFTLIELLVVLSIIAILSGVLISGDYANNKARNNLLTDMDLLATNFRDIQNRTTSFIQDNLVKNIGYGMYLDLSSPTVVSSFYKTSPGDFISSGAGSELPLLTSNKPIEDFIFQTNDYLKRICLNGCNTKTTNKLAIYYFSPKPYSYFSYSDDGLTYDTNLSGATINKVCLEVASKILPNDLRHLDIYYIGQISFGYGPCDN